MVGCFACSDCIMQSFSEVDNVQDRKKRGQRWYD